VPVAAPESLEHKFNIAGVEQRKADAILANMNHKDLTEMGKLIETGQITVVIDRRYGLSDVPEAIRYLETSRARGKVIIAM
jgi:NADPH:quinone reductase-like Zn-dependent oxidoreductase